MRCKTIKWTLVAVATLIATFGQVTLSHAAGLLTSKDGVIPPLTIKDHKVSVVIEDGYAITTVDQVFYQPARPRPGGDLFFSRAGKGRRWAIYNVDRRQTCPWRGVGEKESPRGL